MKSDAKSAFLALSLMTVASCEDGGIMRNYCSDEPVCDKYKCEDKQDPTACRRWEAYCNENPDDKDCRADGGDGWENGE